MDGELEPGGDERTPEPASVPAERRAERRAEREQEQWVAHSPPAQLLDTVNSALTLQANRLDQLFRLHQEHWQLMQQVTQELQGTLKLANEMIAGEEQAREQLMTVTAALAQIATIQQATLDELQSDE